MSTPRPAAAGPAASGWISTIDGRTAAAVAVALAVLLATVGPASVPGFVALAAVALGLTALAALRWPLPTLVAATLLTLADEVIAPRLMPSGIDLGPIGLSEPILLVAGTVIAIGAARRGAIAPALRDAVFVLVLAFAGLAIVSAVLNQVPPVVAVLGIVMTIDAIAIYAVVRMVQMDEGGAGAAVAVIVATVTGLAIIGIAQAVVTPTILGFSGISGEFGEGTRIASIMGSPNMLAAIIGITFPFALFAGRNLPDVRQRWVARACLVVLLLALLLTFSRGGWLAAALGGLVGAALVDWRSLGILAIAAAFAWGASVVLPRDLVGVSAPPDSLPTPAPSISGGDAPTPAATLSPAPSPTAAPEATEAPSIIESTINRLLSLSDPRDTRGRYLRDGLRIVAANPWLGVGPGRYGGAAAAIIPSPVYEEYGATLFEYRTVHNFWLHLLGESGIIGTIVFVTLVALLLLRLVRGARRSEGRRLVLLGGAATMLIVVSLHSVTEMIFEGNMPALLIWLLLGIASLFVPSSQPSAASEAG